MNNSGESDWRKFNNDFGVGGWAGWLAMTQIPANNPVGFAMLTQQELNKNTPIGYLQ